MIRNPLTISVIICAYTEKRWDDMLVMVESLKQQTLPPLEKILVIDHNPVLYEQVRQTFKDMLVIENHLQRGLSGARNSGLEIAKGNVIAFMDEDAYAEPSWLEILCKYFDDENVIGVGGAILPTWSAHPPGWFPDEFNWVVGCTYLGMPQTVARVRNLIGCNMAYRREVFARIGGFKDGIGRVGTFPAGCEETELCIRASQQIMNSYIIYEPLARVHHHVTSNRATLRYFQRRCFAEGRSKALVSSLVGAKDGLASERAYTFKILPRGVLHGIANTLNGDFNGFRRAGAIILGLFLTALGFLSGWFISHWRPPQSSTTIEVIGG